jgi:hypothetical protein
MVIISGSYLVGEGLNEALKVDTTPFENLVEVAPKFLGLTKRRHKSPFLQKTY